MIWCCVALFGIWFVAMKTTCYNTEFFPDGAAEVSFCIIFYTYNVVVICRNVFMLFNAPSMDANISKGVIRIINCFTKLNIISFDWYKIRLIYFCPDFLTTWISFSVKFARQFIYQLTVLLVALSIFSLTKI